MALNPIAYEYLHRIKDAVERNSGLGRVSFWLEKNTTLRGRPYSMKGHEYQREIMDSTHPNVVVSKPSQTGMSEAIVRLVLGFLSICSDIVSIYTLPTEREALRFSKSRMDPVIRGSRYLASSIVGGNDSASFKQIGNSQLFMAGTFGKALISIPTDLLVCDELDFSNPEVIITAESRLSHSSLHDEELDIRGIRRKFSTPTLPQIGVSDLFDKSDRRHRLVRCKHCYEWFWPNFLQHVVVPGYDSSMEEMSYLDVQRLEERGLLPKAQLLCEHCHNPITRDNLQPEYRQWVAENPHVKHIQGFQVSPFDLPEYHNPVSLLRKKLEYKEEEGHFRNFTLGLSYADASNSIMQNAVTDNTCLPAMYPDSASGYGLVMGVDVGKTSWLVVGRPVGGKLHILWAEQIRIGLNQEDKLFETVVKRMKQFHIVRAVVDAMPYTDTMLRIQAQFPPGVVQLSMYTLKEKKAALTVVRESDWVVESSRTRTLDSLVKLINTNKMLFARFPELGVMTSHLQGMKRVDRFNENGELISDWVRTGPDHYFHALNYLNIAARQVQETLLSDWSPGVGIVQATIGSKAEVDIHSSPLNLFGMRGSVYGR